MNREDQRGKPSRDAKRKANRSLRNLENDVARHKGSCLFVVDDSGRFCREPVTNRCHIVSNSKVLSSLRDKDGKVLELQWGISQWRRVVFNIDQDPTNIDIPCRSADDACVGWFACKPEGNAGHDDRFHLIDVADPDFDDPEVRILFAYRMEMFLADQFRLAMKLRSLWNTASMRNSSPSSRGDWFKYMETLRTGSDRAELAVVRLGKAFHLGGTTGTFDPSLVTVRVFEFRSKLRIAGCVFYGGHLATIVLPTDGDKYKMAALYFAGEESEAKEEIGRLEQVTNDSLQSPDYGVAVTQELITKGYGVLAASPESFATMTDQERQTIGTLIAEQSREFELARDLTQQADARKKRRW